MSKRTIRAMTTAALLGCVGPAAAQSRVHQHSEMIHDGVRRSADVDVDGEVRFSDDDRGIAWISPGGRVTIEERGAGPDRRVEYRGTDGGVETRFFRDGREVRPDAGDREWIGRAVLDVMRESGVGAERRVERLYARGGADAVLAEARQIASDGVKRRYYTALLRHPLRADEAARTLRDAGERIAGDGDRRSVLMAGLDMAGRGPRVLEALLQAAQRIASDGDKSSVLVAVAERDALADAAVRQAFFRAATSIASDGDKARVLVAALSRPARREVAYDALRTAATLASDGDKARVLTTVPEDVLDDRGVRDALLAAANGIASDGDRSRVLRWLAGRTR